MLSLRADDRNNPMPVTKVKKNGSVVWRARLRGKDHDLSKYCRTKAEAKEAEEQLRVKLDARKAAELAPQPKEVPTLAAFAREFMETYVKTNNRPSTAREKLRCLNRGLLPLLGHLKLDEIRASEIEGFKAARLERPGRRPLARKTVNEEIGLLGTILSTAREWERIASVPKIKRLKTEAPSFDFLDFDEGERLLAAAGQAPDPWHAMIPFAALTGLRLGELRGLQWDDVDLVARRVHVRHAPDDRGEVHPPKSGKTRIVDLPQRAVAVLHDHRHLRGPFVFCLEDGSALPRWRCESKSTGKRDDGPLAKVCRKAGLRRVGWHMLRHTYASHLVMRGATLAEVQALLGHASVTMTMRYAHLSPAARRAAVDLLDHPAPARGPTRGPETTNAS